MRLIGQAELGDARKKLFQVLAAEMAENVLARDFGAAARHQRDDQRGDECVVHRGDCAPRGRIFVH